MGRRLKRQSGHGNVPVLGREMKCREEIAVEAVFHRSMLQWLEKSVELRAQVVIEQSRV